MSKTINFPEFMENEIINEDTRSPKVAFRINACYLTYYLPKDIVYIRVGEKILRHGLILKNVYKVTFGELDYNILELAKSQMQTKEGVKNILNKIYNIEVNELTPLFIVTYKNIN